MALSSEIIPVLIRLFYETFDHCKCTVNIKCFLLDSTTDFFNKQIYSEAYIHKQQTLQNSCLVIFDMLEVEQGNVMSNIMYKTWTQGASWKVFFNREEKKKI